MIHVDVKKPGNIPDGGGWRYVGRKQGDRNRAATPDQGKNVHHGPKMGQVLSDNGSAYRSFLWRDTCAELAITAKRTRPYRPRTNGTIERFHRTLADGWAYARQYVSQTERRTALPA